MLFSLSDLSRPIVAAPMAGGTSTPALAAAVSNCGGLGFLPAGYLTPQRFAETIAETRSLTSGPLGVNLFVPQRPAAAGAELDAYRRAVGPVARRYGVEPGLPHPDDDHWQTKLDVVADLAPEVVSFTFGCPGSAVLERLRQRGVATWVTVTSPEEAAQAASAGADGLVVQGPEAGGHRSVFAADRTPPDVTLPSLLEQIAGVGKPVVAAGGLGDAGAVRDVLAAGAVAAQVGTALLLSDEAGTSTAHRHALQDSAFAATVVTPCFSGRYARSLVNDFTTQFDAVAPLAYPQVNHITAPIRAAAAKAGDPHGVSLWAGTSWRSVRAGTAADIVASLTG